MLRGGRGHLGHPARARARAYLGRSLGRGGDRHGAAGGGGGLAGGDVGPAPGVGCGRRGRSRGGGGRGEVEERERGGFGVVESSRVLCGARSVGRTDGGDERLGAELTVQILWARQDVDGEDEHSDKTPRPK
jgi:hypothetical protein